MPRFAGYVWFSTLLLSNLCFQGEGLLEVTTKGVDPDGSGDIDRSSPVEGLVILSCILLTGPFCTFWSVYIQ